MKKGELSSKNIQVINILVKSRSITLLRKKFDPNYGKGFKNHLTLVYPFLGIDQRLLSAHIKNSIKPISPFKTKFNRVWKFKNNPYIYLLPAEDSKFMKLYKRLNSGLLKHFKNESIPRYLPHISLGGYKFNKLAEKTIKMIKLPKSGFKVKISSIQLLTLNKNHSIKSIKNFKLK